MQRSGAGFEVEDAEARDGGLRLMRQRQLLVESEASEQVIDSLPDRQMRVAERIGDLRLSGHLAGGHEHGEQRDHQRGCGSADKRGCGSHQAPLWAVAARSSICTRCGGRPSPKRFDYGDK